MPTNERTDLTLRLARWVVDLDYDDLPAEVLDIAKLVVLDQLGVQLRGATLPNVAPILRMVEAMQARPEATIALSPARTTAAYAAYVNGSFGHSAQYDDSHALAWHIGSCVVPTALAFAELGHDSGRDVLVAVVAGAQVMALLGSVMTPTMQRVGWHGAKVLGVFAAAATAGKLLRLSADELAQALAISASEASGTMEYDRSGGEIKRLHSGAAARSGAQAALLAQSGMTGPLTVIEGPRGLFRLFGGAEDVAPLEAAWSRFQILDTIFRMYPAVGTVAAPLDAIAELLAEHRLDWRQIERIRVGLVPYAVSHGATIRRPQDVLSAQFSLAFSAGLLLVRGANRPQDYFNPELWTDADVLAAGDLVEVYETEFEADVPILSARVDIRLADGHEVGRLRRGFRGHPASPASRSDLEAKFAGNVEGIVDDATAAGIVEAIRHLEQLDDIGGLMTRLAAQV
jgi:2-methylcitrate dehydratase PrpD